MKLRKWIAVLLSLLMAAAMAVPAMAAGESKTGVKAVRDYCDLPYGDGKGEAHSYDLYIPESAFGKSQVPLLLYIHGGGFDEGSKDDDDNMMFLKPYLEQGYVIVNANYTLLTGEDPGFGISNQNDELYDAMKSATKKLQELKVNCKEMATLGYSAGGCLALLYGYAHPENSPIPVRFVIEGSGPADFNLPIWESTAELLGRGSTEDMIKKYGGVKEGETLQEGVDRISPASYVNEKTVPTVMLYGERDLLVPPKAKDRLIENLKKYNVKYDLISCPYAGHLVYLLPSWRNKWENKALEYCETYFGKA